MSEFSLYRRLLDESSGPVFCFDPDYRYLYANQALADGIGRKLEEVIGKTIWDVFPKVEADKRFVHVKWVFDHRQNKEFEMLVSRPDGDHHYLTTLKPLLDDHGRVSAVLANSKEITQRKQAEDALRQNEAYTRTILDSVFDQVAVIDRGGIITAVNAQWHSFSLENGPHPAKPADYTDVGTNYLDVCRVTAGSESRLAGSAGEGIQAVLDGHIPTFSLEYPCHSPEQKRWFRMRVTPLGSQRSGAVIAHTNITDQILANEALSQSECLLKSMTAAVPGVVYQFCTTSNGEWKFLYLSKRIEELYEVTAESALRDHSLITDCILADDRVSHRESIQRSAATLDFWEHEHRIKTPTGNFKWVRGQATPQRQGDGSVLWNGILTDITERKRVEAELLLSANVFKNAREGITVTNADGTIININDAFTRITGYGREEVLGQNHRILQSGRQSQEFYRKMWSDLIEQGYWSGEIWNCRKNGEIYPEELSISAVRAPSGQVVQYVAFFSDIKRRKLLEQEVHQLAFFDPLTQLANRRLLDDRLTQAMAASKRNGCYYAVIMLDLDNFKPLNDAHGHLAGDSLLREVGRRLTECVRGTDTVARIGGDEFVVVIGELDADKVESTKQAREVAEKIRASLADPYRLTLNEGGLAGSVVEHRCSASIGVALFLSDEASQADILKWADAAMYRAKDAGRNAIRFYGLPR